MARGTGARLDPVASLLDRADIVEVAQGLGLQVEARLREPRRAICPFHDDKDPSLNLYSSGRVSGERSHYHCFVCGAHGDVATLVQKYENLSFREAIGRLAEILGEPLDALRRRPLPPRDVSTELAEIIKSNTPSEMRFANYAKNRGFDPSWLHDAGVAVVSLDSMLESARSDRVIEESLIGAGLARPIDHNASAPELWAGGLRGFFFGSRLVFRINNEHGDVAGFAARTLGDDKPKYLYSYSFRRRDVLYRADVVLAKLADDHRNRINHPIDIYIVEGLFDALRLESLGIYSVAILGSQVTHGQIEILKRIASTAARNQRELCIHIFFDSDNAGRRGAYDATIAALKLLGEVEPFLLDVVWPRETDAQKVDPDTALKQLDVEAARYLLSGAAVSPLVFLATHLMDSDPHVTDWDSIQPLKLASVARRIAVALADAPWDRIIAPTNFANNQANGSARLAQLVGVYAGSEISRTRGPMSFAPFKSPTDKVADLLTALTLGRSSTSRREYPFDDASWDRLATAASTFFHLHAARLATGDGPSAPLLARDVPKGGGRYRLKSGPVAEDTVIQQYVLLGVPLISVPKVPVFCS